MGPHELAALRIVAPPPNDNFANAQVAAGDPVTGTITLKGVTLYGTSEQGEPNPTGVGGGHSVWYKWTAPAAGQVQLAAYSSSLDMVAAVYTGSSLAGLTLVGANNNESGLNTDSLVTFTANAGQTYFFQVDNLGSAGGNFTLMVNNSSWQFATMNAITSTPAVGSDGAVYIGSTDGSLYAVNADGSPRWSFPTAGYIDNASPALGSNGAVCVGSSDGYLMRSTASPARSIGSSRHRARSRRRPRSAATGPSISTTTSTSMRLRPRAQRSGRSR